MNAYPIDGTVVAVTGLRTHFTTPKGIVRSLEDVAFHVKAGKTVALVGESGSGKSVTSLSLMRLLPRAGKVVSGSVLFRDGDGEVIDMAVASERIARRVRGGGIGMIFQEPMSSLNPAFTIGSQIAESVRRHQGGSRANARNVSVSLLEKVGITDPGHRIDAYPHQLSGGMRQRAAIAMAVACRPRVLIADEPTTALDVTTQAQVLQMLRGLQAESSMGMLFITHNLALLPMIADRVMVMYAGQIVEEGTTQGVLARPRHPYTRALLECLPARHLPRPAESGWRPLPTIQGVAPSLLTRPKACSFSNRCPLAVSQCVLEMPTLLGCGDDAHYSRCFRWNDL